VWLAARRRPSAAAEYPEAKVAKKHRAHHARLLATENERERGFVAAPLRLEEEQTHYEVLETEPGVSDEEVRRAYVRSRDLLVELARSSRGFTTRTSWRRCIARANAAHATVSPPERRRAVPTLAARSDLAAPRW